MIGLIEQAIDQRRVRRVPLGRRAGRSDRAGAAAGQGEPGRGRPRVGGASSRRTPDLVGIAGFDSESGPGMGQAIREAGRARAAGRDLRRDRGAAPPAAQRRRPDGLHRPEARAVHLLRACSARTTSRTRGAGHAEGPRRGDRAASRSTTTRGRITVTRETVDLFLRREAFLVSDLRFAVVGAGFWARYQLAAWGEAPGVQCVAICDRDRARAEATGPRLRRPGRPRRRPGDVRRGAARFPST